MAVKATTRDRIVEGPEVELLLKLLSESQNVNRYSFGAEFFSRYTQTVSGAEQQIVSKANHIVFGRRGAGKTGAWAPAVMTGQDSARGAVTVTGWCQLRVASSFLL